MFLFGQKAWERFKNNERDKALAQYESINAQYKLGIPQEVLFAHADKWGEMLANAQPGTHQWDDPMDWIGAMLTTAITIFSGFLTAGSTWVIAASVVIGTIAGLTQLGVSFYMEYVNDNIAFLELQTQSDDFSLATAKEANKYAQESDKITAMLVFNPYAICANGAVYKEQSAGSESFSPTKAYDPNKGLLGQSQTEPIDEMTQNRAHKASAGNQNYFQSTLRPSAPLAVGGLSATQMLDSLENNFREANERINRGFSLLFEAGFGQAGGGDELYKQTQEKQLAPTKNNINNIDFLDKIKNYNRGLRADFNYVRFAKKPFSDSERQERLKSYLEWVQSALKGEHLSLEEVAYYYYDSILQVILEFLKAHTNFYVLKPMSSTMWHGWDNFGSKFAGFSHYSSYTSSTYGKAYAAIMLQDETFKEESQIPFYDGDTYNGNDFIEQKAITLFSPFQEIARARVAPSALVAFYEQIFTRQINIIYFNPNNHNEYKLYNTIHIVAPYSPYSGHSVTQFPACRISKDEILLYRIPLEYKDARLLGYDFSKLDKA